jgi:DNA-binding transcriptional LysR family regulator
MNFQQLRFVVAVAETKSFTSAADLCCVTQPARSNAIAQLEDEFGGKLFERTTRSVALTPLGVTIIDDMRGILNAKSRLLMSASDYVARDDRTVRIGMSPLISGTYVEAILTRISKLDTNLKPIISEMNKDRIGPGLESGEINIGLGPEPWDQDKYISKLIYSEPLLYVSDAPTVAVGEAETLEVLAGKDVLLVGDDCGLSTAIRNLFRDNQMTLTEYEGKAHSYGVLEKWAQLGIGVALLPASKITDVSRARRVCGPNGGTISIDFHACWTPETELGSNFSTIIQALQTDI